MKKFLLVGIGVTLVNVLAASAQPSCAPKIEIESLVPELPHILYTEEEGYYTFNEPGYISAVDKINKNYLINDIAYRLNVNGRPLYENYDILISAAENYLSIIKGGLRDGRKLADFIPKFNSDGLPVAFENKEMREAALALAVDVTENQRRIDVANRTVSYLRGRATDLTPPGSQYLPGTSMANDVFLHSERLRVSQAAFDLELARIELASLEESKSLYQYKLEEHFSEMEKALNICIGNCTAAFAFRPGPQAIYLPAGTPIGVFGQDIQNWSGIVDDVTKVHLRDHDTQPLAVAVKGLAGVNKDIVERSFGIRITQSAIIKYLVDNDAIAMAISSYNVDTGILTLEVNHDVSEIMLNNFDWSGGVKIAGSSRNISAFLIEGGTELVCAE